MPETKFAMTNIFEILRWIFLSLFFHVATVQAGQPENIATPALISSPRQLEIKDPIVIIPITDSQRILFSEWLIKWVDVLSRAPSNIQKLLVEKFNIQAEVLDKVLLYSSSSPSVPAVLTKEVSAWSQLVKDIPISDLRYADDYRAYVVQEGRKGVPYRSIQLTMKLDKFRLCVQYKDFPEMDKLPVNMRFSVEKLEASPHHGQQPPDASTLIARGGEVSKIIGAAGSEESGLQHLGFYFWNFKCLDSVQSTITFFN